MADPVEESQLMFYFLYFRSLPSDVFGTLRGFGDDRSHWSPLVTLEPSGVYGYLRIFSQDVSGVLNLLLQKFSPTFLNPMRKLI